MTISSSDEALGERRKRRSDDLSHRFGGAVYFWVVWKFLWPARCWILSGSSPRMAIHVLQNATLAALERQFDASLPNVLVVDDTPEVTRSLERDLRAFPCRVISATSAREAVERVGDLHLSLRAAIVDLCLGTSDGLELLEALHRHDPRTKRVLMSGAIRPDQLRLALHSGQVDDVLPKPWDRGALERVISVPARP